jgi:hypothetical protein
MSMSAGGRPRVVSTCSRKLPSSHWNRKPTLPHAVRPETSADRRRSACARESPTTGPRPRSGRSQRACDPHCSPASRGGSGGVLPRRSMGEWQASGQRLASFSFGTTLHDTYRPRNPRVGGDPRLSCRRGRPASPAPGRALFRGAHLDTVEGVGRLWRYFEVTRHDACPRSPHPAPDPAAARTSGHCRGRRVFQAPFPGVARRVFGLHQGGRFPPCAPPQARASRTCA